MKKKEQVAKPKPVIQELEEIEVVPEEEQNVVFKPNEGPQTEFLAAGEREVLYGGSAGGGKSFAMLADPLRYMGIQPLVGCSLDTQRKNSGNLYSNRKNSIRKSGKGSSGQKEKCNG